MNLRASAVVLLTAFSATMYAQDKPVTYAVHIEVVGNQRDFSCTFAPKGKELAGSCKDMTDFSGTVDGDTYTWRAQGQEAGLVFTGKRGADGVITGTVHVPDYNVDGEFKAVPQK